MEFKRAMEIRKAVLKKDSIKINDISKEELLEYIYSYNDPALELHHSVINKHRNNTEDLKEFARSVDTLVSD